MDFIRKFDIELEKEYYYAGEKLKGWVVIENIENLKVRGEWTSEVVRVALLIFSIRFLLSTLHSIFTWHMQLCKISAIHK